MTSEIFSIIQSCSIIIASIVAILGISSWRREGKWKRKYEIAEEALALFYECKEKISIIRSPFSNTLEGKSRKKGENETPQETESLDSAYIYVERYEKHKEPFNKLSSLKFRFMTQFGKEAGLYFDELGKIINQVFFAAHHLGELKFQESRKLGISDNIYKLMEKYEKIIWEDFEKDDEIKSRINNSIREIEKYCEKII